MKRVWWGIAAVVLAAVLVVATRARAGTALRRTAAEARYDARDFKGAYEDFETMARDASPSATELAGELELDAGNSAYRLGKFQDAVRHYRAALGGSARVAQHAQYDLGNTYVWIARGETDRRSSLRAAVNAYEEAVLADPSDVNAKWNLELTVVALANEEQRLGGGPHRDEANWGGGNLTKSGYAGAPQTGAGATPGGGYGNGGGDEAVPEITPTQARRLLEETQRAMLTGQDVRRVSPSRAPEHIKDW